MLQGSKLRSDREACDRVHIANYYAGKCADVAYCTTGVLTVSSLLVVKQVVPSCSSCVLECVL
jgi:hypothetical protein